MRKAIVVEKTEQQQIEEKETNNVVDLHVIGGGKDSGNWLQNMEAGTVFLVNNKKNFKDWRLGLFRLIEKTEKSAILQTPAETVSVYVIPAMFCLDWDLHEVIGVIEIQQTVPEEEQEEPVENADERDRIQGKPSREAPKLDGDDKL